PSVLAGLNPPAPFVEPREPVTIPASLPGDNIKIKSEILLSPLQHVIKRANDEGEHIPGFSGIYPVFENAQQQRYYKPLPFKQLKEFKMACAQYSPSNLFPIIRWQILISYGNLSLLSNVGSQPISTGDRD
ncbi:hypothetical protein ACVWOM_30120, partial [Pseudomonas aeruginosa]